MLERMMQVLFRRSGFDLGCHKFEYGRDAVWKSFTLKAIGPVPGFFKRRSWATSWVKGPIRYELIYILENSHNQGGRTTEPKLSRIKLNSHVGVERYCRGEQARA